jgi:hypothetical protein
MGDTAEIGRFEIAGNGRGAKQQGGHEVIPKLCHARRRLADQGRPQSPQKRQACRDRSHHGDDKGATDMTAQQAMTAPASAVAIQTHATTEPIEFIELGLALDLLLESHPIFSEAVRAALLPLDGEFLFDLPHSQKANGKGRIAAVRLAYAGAAAQRLVFAFLSDDGMDAHVAQPAKDQDHLASFAEAFVGVLEKIGH